MKGKGKQTKPADAPGEGTEVTTLAAGLVMPVASDDALEEGFRRYNKLKERLLDETDYTWFAVVKVSDKETRKGFRKKSEAEAAIADVRTRNMKADLEKKVKKSGCLKLSKAFGISTEIISESLDRETYYAYYKVRATAPNGQRRDRTGSCSRDEKGKATDPFDSVQATAVTRAEDRAIMALLGGENTAEEFISEEPPVTPKSDSPAPRPNLSPEEKARLAKLDKKFAGKEPAGPDDNQRKAHLLRKMFALAAKAKMKPEHIKRGCISMWKIDSTKNLSIDQIGVIIDGLEARLKGEIPF